MPFVPLQLSLTVTPPSTFGTAAWQLPSALALVGAGQLTVGTVASVTVNVVVQVALLPTASVAVTVIVCAPRPTSVPAAGDWLRVIAFVALQLSLAVTSPNTFGTAAWQPASALALVGAGQLTLGTVVSVTVNVVAQVALLPAASVAVTVIECVPTPISVPAAGDWVRVIAPALEQLWLTVTPPSTLGTTAWQFASALRPGTVEQLTLGAPGSTLSVAVLVTTPATAAHCPLAITCTVCWPEAKPVVGNVKLGPLVPTETPSKLH